MHRQALPSNRAKGLRPHKGLHDAYHVRLRGRPAGAYADVGGCAVVGTQGLVALAGLRTLGFGEGSPL